MIPFQKEDHKRSLKPRGALSLIVSAFEPKSFNIFIQMTVKHN